MNKIFGYVLMGLGIVGFIFFIYVLISSFTTYEGSQYDYRDLNKLCVSKFNFDSCFTQNEREDLDICIKGSDSFIVFVNSSKLSNWDGHLKDIDYKTSCYMIKNNG